MIITKLIDKQPKKITKKHKYKNKVKGFTKW